MAWRHRRMLDLFSGFGGASEAFVQGRGWEVIRVESEPMLEDVPHTVPMDVREVLDSELVGTYDVVWASPPCREFSLAYNAPGPRAQREGRDFEPSLELGQAAKAVIDCLEPRWWVIENVRGAIPHLEPILGEPTLIVGPFVLWGVFPTLDIPRGFEHQKGSPSGSADPLRSQRRAIVPYEISRALRDAIEQTRTLDHFPSE